MSQREADRLLDRLARLARQSHDERAVDLDAERLGVPRELARAVEADALLDVVEDRPGCRTRSRPAAGAGRCPCSTLSVSYGTFGLGVARPRHAQPPEPARDRLGPRPVVGEGVVVEEVLLHLREEPLRVRDLGHHVLDRARAVAVAAHRLRPQAEGALRAAAAAGVERDVGMLQVADEVVLDRRGRACRRRPRRAAVHVLERRDAPACDWRWPLVR